MATRDGPPGWDLEKVLTTLTVKNYHITKHLQLPQDPLVQPQQWKRDMKFGTWNMRNLYRSGSLTTVARELARYK